VSPSEDDEVGVATAAGRGPVATRAEADDVIIAASGAVTTPEVLVDLLFPFSGLDVAEELELVPSSEFSLCPFPTASVDERPPFYDKRKLAAK